jgi:nucleoside-diphosphate-sugar epimerase
VVAAFAAVLEAPEERVAGRAFNVATGVGTPLVEAVRTVAAAAARLTGRAAPIRHVEPEGRSTLDQRSFVGDASALSAATGWSPRVAVADGLERLVGDCYGGHSIPSGGSGLQ